MSSAAILIPCYNAADFIEATIRSAVDNMDEGEELVLIDDHSEDDSFSVDKQFLNQSSVNFNAPTSPEQSDARNAQSYLLLY